MPGGPVAHYDLGYVPALDYTPGASALYLPPSRAPVGREPAPARTDTSIVSPVALPYSLLVLSAHAKKGASDALSLPPRLPYGPRPCPLLLRAGTVRVAVYSTYMAPPRGAGNHQVFFRYVRDSIN